MIKNSIEEELEAHAQRLLALYTKVTKASDKVVEHPYRLQPSLGVTQREKALFAYYEELYLWEHPEPKKERMVLTKYL